MDIFELDYLTIMKRLNANLPILFVFSNFDSIVPAQEVLEFYNAYNGPKDLCEIYRTHDEDRPDDLFRQGIMWLTRSKKKNMRAIVQAREQLIDKRRREQERSRSQADRSQLNRLCSTSVLPSNGFFCR